MDQLLVAFDSISVNDSSNYAKNTPTATANYNNLIEVKNLSYNLLNQSFIDDITLNKFKNINNLINSENMLDLSLYPDRLHSLVNFLNEKLNNSINAYNSSNIKDYILNCYMLYDGIISLLKYEETYENEKETFYGSYGISNDNTAYNYFIE